EPKPTLETEKIRSAPLHAKPYWDLERARIGGTRTVPVQVVVNGVAVAQKAVPADGTEEEGTVEGPIEQSSWGGLRGLPPSHTNPVFVLVGDKPVRASKRSAEWCLKAIDKCWEQKVRGIREKERPEAQKAYDRAREEYKKILAESVTD